ncbi:PspC domain-containing protein [Flavobacterium franklandianum]|uniref:PspC domain-containing protein n=1 Tax=Flavobacterium franklandianum TaxID=2594430 RepID=A0A553CKD5_9FLAO|nr:PspC domain-containing protein [Flavobacterium franklandianum]TRX20959.1 PspC domain-containing protein [Flavobacterium franklandianum]TRX24126.1 PspC domain-containing protein [Flavobacterium franklandianum]
MNKTVNINLGGMFFHIDEDAYQKLTRYFDAIKRSLSNSSGQDEIIKDIEMRVSELLTEKQKTEKHVVGLKDVDEVIAVMGQPEDYRIDEEGIGTTSTNYSSSTSTASRKLYRDKEGGMIGGVLAGLGHYFGIDKVWLRIFFLIMFFAWGTGVLAYIILWIVMPEAVTTAEKLEMTGEPVTISNIEKKVREEFENVSDKFKNANYDEMGNRVKTGAEKIGSSLSDFIIAVLRVFSKILGVILIIAGLCILAALFIAVFTLGSSSLIDVPWQGFIEAGNFTDYPVWTFGLIMFFAVGIPFFFLALLGFKLLSPNLKSIGNIAKSTLLAIWIIAVSLAIAIGLKQASAFAIDGRVVVKENFNLKPTDTLLIKFKHNDYFAKNIDDNSNFKITIDSTGNDVIYSNNVSFKIAQTDTQSAYIQIEKEAKGKNLFEAKQRAEKIKYSYKIIGNQLVFDNYLLTDLKEKFRDQDIEITLFLPLGTLLKMDDSVARYDQTDDDYFYWHPNENEIFKVESDKIKCQNCLNEDNENITIDTKQETDSVVTTTVTVNGEVVKVKETTTKKGLSVDKDGVIIKNN